MPKILEHRGYKFYFFSNEGLPLERCHIHIRKDFNRCKFWIDPEISLAENIGMSAHELNILEKTVEEKQDLIRSKYNEYFG